MIPTICQWSCDSNIDLNSSFAFNQTSDIFHPKILYALLSASNLPYINSDIISFTPVLALFKEKVLCILWSQGQVTCLIPSLEEKTIYKSTLFWIRWWWNKGGFSHSMESHWRSHKKSGMKTAEQTRSALTLGTSTLASTAFVMCEGLSFLCGRDERRSRHNSRWSSGFTQIDPDG